MFVDDFIIGPSGCDTNFYDAGFKRGFEVPEFLKSIGLNAFEYSFGRGFNASLETCSVIGKYAKQNGITYSVHAPFYINFANTDAEMINKSIGYVMGSVDRLYAFGGTHLVFHPASQGKLERSVAVSTMTDNIKRLLDILYREGKNDIFLCPETMGKSLQIGTFEEIVNLCSIDKMLVPCFDFGHINALTGGSLKTPADFVKVFDYCKSVLGEDKTNNCHVHFSKIEYGAKGEIRHLNFDDVIYGPDYFNLAKAIKQCRVSPHLICESQTKMSGDALIFKNMLKKV